MRSIAFFLLIATSTLSAQDLFLTSEGNLTFGENASLYVKGVEFLPTPNFQLQGPNEWNTVDNSNDPAIVNRVFSSSDFIADYSGHVIFYYGDVDLNELKEESLTMAFRTQEQGWTNVKSKLDKDVKSLDFDVKETTSFSAITATEDQTLSMESFNEQSIKIYPNPASDFLTVVFENPLNIELIDLSGKTLISTQKKDLDLSNLAVGVYCLKATPINSDHSIYKKVIKK